MEHIGGRHRVPRRLVPHIQGITHVLEHGTYLVIGGLYELLVQRGPVITFREGAPPLQRRFVKGAEKVGNVVLEHTPLILLLAPIEAQLIAQFISRSKKIGIVKFALYLAGQSAYRTVGADTPTVAGDDAHDDGVRVVRNGHYLDRGIGNILSRTKQLLVAHHRPRIESVTLLKQEVAFDGMGSSRYMDGIRPFFQIASRRVENGFAHELYRIDTFTVIDAVHGRLIDNLRFQLRAVARRHDYQSVYEFPETVPLGTYTQRIVKPLGAFLLRKRIPTGHHPYAYGKRIRMAGSQRKVANGQSRIAYPGSYEYRIGRQRIQTPPPRPYSRPVGQRRTVLDRS